MIRRGLETAHQLLASATGSILSAARLGSPSGAPDGIAISLILREV